MLVAIDREHPGALRLTDRPYDRAVAGVVSGANGLNPGLLMTQASPEPSDHPVALTGRVYCLADASYGAIRPGDLLTTSKTPGHAMRAKDARRMRGAVIGKAMSELDSGTGMVLLLVSMQ